VYRYVRGWNWKAVAALVVGIVMALGGAYTATGTQGPFPADGIIPILKPLYDYSWAVGFVVAFAVYAALTRFMVSSEALGPQPELAA
jgi:NCS1 family nucleobase:cation symporter-1